jgi:hypothetical protein
MNSAIYLGNTLVNGYFDNASILAFQNKNPFLSIDYILVAGGGGGGYYGNESFALYRGGGGGAGAILTSSAIIPLNDSIGITIGEGGIGATGYGIDTTNGGNSTITVLSTTYTTIGGGGGGNGVIINGKSGGSGGGGGLLLNTNGTFNSNGTGGSSTQVSTYGYGLGQPGCNGGVEVNGGAGGSSVSTTNTNCPTAAQPGLIWLDGVTYAFAGDGQAGQSENLQFRGYGGNRNYNGGIGTCVIRYPGVAVATGGTITYADGYTYHTFNSNGTFTY